MCVMRTREDLRQLASANTNIFGKVENPVKSEGVSTMAVLTLGFFSGKCC